VAALVGGLDLRGRAVCRGDLWESLLVSDCREFRLSGAVLAALSLGGDSQVLECRAD
jgi:hypothetical protein